MGEIELSLRLRTIADMVSEGLRVADVGCDHAYISIYLLQSKRASQVTAMDIGRGPLEIARKNIAANGLEGKIRLLLSDGTLALEKDWAEAVVIAGMGGILIRDIIAADIDRFRRLKEFILGPQSELQLLRGFLYQEGFTIISEKAVCEDGKFYPVIKAVPGESPMPEDFALRYGPKLLENKNKILKKKLYMERAKYTELAENIKAVIREDHLSDPDEKALKKRERLEGRLRDICRDLELNERALDFMGEDYDLQGSDGMSVGAGTL